MSASDTSYSELNREQTERLKALRGLSDAELNRPVGEHWTVAVALAHIQYWDGRGLGAIEARKRHGVPLAWWRNNEAAVNDLRLDLHHGRLEQAIVTAEALCRVVPALTRAEAEAVATQRYRVLEPALHRNDLTRNRSGPRPVRPRSLSPTSEGYWPRRYPAALVASSASTTTWRRKWSRRRTACRTAVSEWRTWEIDKSTESRGHSGFCSNSCSNPAGCAGSQGH
jgi:hypothetical protein